MYGADWKIQDSDCLRPAVDPAAGGKQKVSESSPAPASLEGLTSELREVGSRGQ